jgi:two-component system sensor histidine kinase PhoQ
MNAPGVLTSLRVRVVAVASLVLAAFLGVTGVALERAFRETGMELVHEHLQAQVYALLAAADPAADGSLPMDGLPEPRFALPDSGLYALVREAGGRVLWRSRSLLGRNLDLAPPQQAGTPRFGEFESPWGERFFVVAYRVRWELGSGAERVFDLHVAESRSALDGRIARYRRDLWTWLAGLAAGLLAAQALVLTVGLAPLRRLAQDVQAIEAGERVTLSEDQPQELRPLAANLNHLIRVGQRTVERHRNALADLAHALKTPMAVLRGAAEDAGPGQEALRETVLDSVARMDEALVYRLRRAAAAGDRALPVAVAVEPLAQRLCATLRKVYAGKALVLDVSAEHALQARVDPGDFTEILGNLLDNACKWASSRVLLTLRGGDGGHGLFIVVEDDGPGIASLQRTRILERGARADEHTPGQGIGLSVVHELAVHQYGGSIEVEDSAAEGGACIRVHLDVPVD